MSNLLAKIVSAKFTGSKRIAAPKESNTPKAQKNSTKPITIEYEDDNKSLRASK